MYSEVFGYTPIKLYPGQSTDIKIAVPEDYSPSDYSIKMRIDSAYTNCNIIDNVEVLDSVYTVPSELSEKILGEYYVTFEIKNNNTGNTIIDKVLLKVKRYQ